MNRFILFAVATMGCSSSGPSLEKATIGRLTFGTPSGWAKRDLSNPQRAMFEWAPSTDENERKESLTVVRADRPATAKSTQEQLQQMLAGAQRGMVGASFSAPHPFTTRHGLRGVRIDGDFVVPQAAGARYRRIHAVIVDGTSLVNVLYTAREPDRETFEAVVDSFFREGV